jgi:hypothetical protein
MLIDFGAGSRQLFTATVNQTVTYGLATIRPELREQTIQSSVSALPFHEKAGLSQDILWLRKFISDVFFRPDIG